jgi:hypothetical protein
MTTHRTSLVSFVPLPTHAALRVSDIVEVIVEHIASTDGSTTQEKAAHEDLITLSTLNRVFSAPALDQLWTDADVRSLARVMPADTCHTYAVERSYWEHFQGTGLVDAGACAVEQLLSGRFFFYSRRVRRLAWAGARRFVAHSVLAFWLRARETLFPRLVGHCFVPGEALYMCYFRQMPEYHVYPVTSVKVVIGPAFARLLNARNYDMEFLAEMTAPVGPYPTLVHFECTLADGVRLEPGIELALGGMLRALLHGAPLLRDVHSRDILLRTALLHLATAPELRRLSIGAVQADIKEPLPPHSFQALEDIDIMERPHADAGAHTTLEFFAREPSSALRCARLGAPDHGALTLQAWETLTRGVGVHTSLARLSLDFSLTGTREMSHAERAAALWRILEPLAALVQLEYLRLCGAHAFVLPEERVLELLSHWPHLRVWSNMSVGREGASSLRPLHEKWLPPAHAYLPLSMRALMRVMLQHPLLLELPVGAQCGSLPGDGLVQEVEALKHSYGGPVRLEDYDEDQVEEVEEIMERCFPHVRYGESMTL